MTNTFLTDIKTKGKRGLAEALSTIEEANFSFETCKMLDEAFQSSSAKTIGITGPPGVGKSSLINSLVQHWRLENNTIGVIAVDPSSHKSGGALLGDRTRMMLNPEDDGVFFRSLASKGVLGGLSDFTYPALILMRALFDILIIETVGVGQSEADIADVADIVALCIQPGSGDSLQFMKAGIMEIPDIAIVTKADFGPTAQRTANELAGAMGLTGSNAAKPDNHKLVHLVSSTKNEGIDTLAHAMEHHPLTNDGPSKSQRHLDQGKLWLEKAITGQFGTYGLSKVKRSITDESMKAPFVKFRSLTVKLSV